MMRPETKSVPPEMIKLIPVDLCISICVNFYFAYMGTCFFYIPVVPGQAGGGSFKEKKL